MRRALLILASLYTGLANGAVGEASFTPSSVVVPIRQIALANATTESPLYTCAAGTEAGCLVDITNEAALSALFTPAPTLVPGTYDRLYVATCMSEGLYHAQVTGSTTLGGTTYYTQTGAEPLTTIAGSAGPATVEFTGCRRTYLLPSPVTVTMGSTVNINLFVAINGIAWATLGPGTIPSGCVQNAAGTRSVCMGYPDVVPYVGTPGTVSLERYAIIENVTDPATFGGFVLLVADAADNAIAGFTRRYFSASSQSPAANFDTPLKTITPGAGGIYYLENYGSTATDTGYARLPTFRREEHDSDYLLADGASVPYYAYRDIVAELPACAAGGPVLDSYPMNYSAGSTPPIPDLTALVPLGNLNPSGHVFPTDHMYFYLPYVIPGDPSGGDVDAVVLPERWLDHPHHAQQRLVLRPARWPDARRRRVFAAIRAMPRGRAALRPRREPVARRQRRTHRRSRRWRRNLRELQHRRRRPLV